MKMVIYFSLTTTVGIVVEAKDLDEADKLVRTLGPDVRPELEGAKAVYKIAGVSVEEPPEDARLSTYTCHFCRKQTLKHQWGPGRVRCPKCGRFAPSVAELTKSRRK